MTQYARIALIAGLGAMTAACGGGGLLNRDRPDEFAVQRQAPLVVPPEFVLSTADFQSPGSCGCKTRPRSRTVTSVRPLTMSWVDAQLEN